VTYRGIQTTTVTMQGHRGDTIEAYVSRPEGDGPFPGVVVIHHYPGWDEWTCEVTWKLAHHGFATIAPHLWHRFGPGDPDDVGARGRGMGGMADDEVVGDVAGAARYLRGQPYHNGKVGIIGFCSGGRQVYIAACKLSDIDAAVDCWGGGVIVDDESQLNEKRPVAPITMTPDLNCPLLGIFGNDDDNPPPAEVDRVEEELKRLGKTYEFYRYDGAGHAFFSTDRYRYRPEQAVDAWNKVYAFFGRHLHATGSGGGPQRFIGASPNVSLSGKVPLRPS
jgi:carboxymethylenebutenolidase